jgi:hypothetical protein
MNLKTKDSISITRIIVKAISLFILINFLFILLKDIPYGSISLYNSVFPGRERLPFGETPSESFNLTISNIDAMLSSHKISADTKTTNDYRIIIIGDSSIWGFLQKPENTLAGILEKKLDNQCIGKDIEVFNLGYPSLSVLKDLVILNKIEAYKPDLVIWFITLEALVSDDQLNTPLIKNNALELNKKEILLILFACNFMALYGPDQELIKFIQRNIFLPNVILNLIFHTRIFQLIN